MANPLVPTAVTDKNGRITTVHKRLDASQSASKTMKVPAPVLSPVSVSSAPQRTLLTPPETLTPEESQEFDAWYREALVSSQYNERATKLYVDNVDPEPKAIAWRLIQDGIVNPRAVMSMLNDSKKGYLAIRSIDPEIKKVKTGVLVASLLVAERMSQEYPNEVREDGPNISRLISRAIKGYAYSTKIDDRHMVTGVATEEELASLTAVTTFLFHADANNHDNQQKWGNFKDSELQQVEGLWIANRRLDAFLRENPSQTPRVIEYMNTREMGTSAKDFKALVAYLQESEDFGVLEDGWL